MFDYRAATEGVGGRVFRWLLLSPVRLPCVRPSSCAGRHGDAVRKAFRSAGVCAILFAARCAPGVSSSAARPDPSAPFPRHPFVTAFVLLSKGPSGKSSGPTKTCGTLSEKLFRLFLIGSQTLTIATPFLDG